MDGGALVRWLESMRELYGPPEGVLFRVQGRPLLLPLADSPADPPAPPYQANRELRHIHEKLLSVATPEPQTAKQLAHRAGYSSCNTYVRQAIRELVDWDMLRRVSAGYVLKNGPNS